MSWTNARLLPWRRETASFVRLFCFSPWPTTDDSIDDEANRSDGSTEGEFTWTPEEEVMVRRKLDRVIVPLTTFLYLLCFLDRYVVRS